MGIGSAKTSEYELGYKGGQKEKNEKGIGKGQGR